MLSADANLLEDLQEIANVACTTLSYNSFKCCGFCDYEYNCEEHGSCCLDGYPTLAHARDSVEKSR